MNFSREQDCRQDLLESARTIVVKVGSRLLTNDGRVDLDQIRSLVGQIARLADQQRHVCLVSSGAVGTAMTLLDSDRPTGLGRLQAYAAIGQAELIHHYNREFEKYQKRAAQVLLTMDDMNHRKRYLNLRNTIFSLFDLNAIPVINENDCVATDEIAVTFGDNDRLAANVAMLVDADLLIILSDVDAVYDRDPQDNAACKIGFIDQVDDSTLDYAQTKSTTGRSFSKGGMSSKLQSAKIAASVGIPAVIAGGRESGVIESILQGKPVGTLVAGSRQTANPRKRWIKSALDASGCLAVDDGAATALRDHGKSLLPIGVTSVSGRFDAGDVVRIIDTNGIAIGKGITNYSSSDANLILGMRSGDLIEKLGRVTNEEMIHRDNLVLE